MSNDKYKNMTLLICSLIILSRLFFIDIDPPKLSHTYYQPMDEAYYVEWAYDFYEYGQLSPYDDVVFFGIPYLSNLVTYISLSIFGDNYLGLRASSIFFALGSFYFFFLILKRIIRDNKILLFTSILFVTAFSFSWGSIIVEPTIARLCCLTLTMYISIRYLDAKNSFAFDIAYCLVALMLCITCYITNLFTVAAAFIIIFYKNVPTNNSLSKSVFSIGTRTVIVFLISITVFFLITFFLLKIIGKYSLSEIIAIISERGGNYDNRVGLSLSKILRNILNIVKSGVFYSNFVYIPITLISIFFLISEKHYKNPVVFTVLSFFIMFIAQTAFINDYPRRKLLILLPFVLFLGALLFELFPYNNRKKLNLYFLTFIILTLISCLGYFIYLTSWYDNNLIYLSTLIIPGFVIILSFGMFKKNTKTIALVLIGALILLSELTFAYKYFIKEKNYYYRDAMISLKKYDNELFYGGYSKGFRVYNHIKPHINPYYYYGKLDIFNSKIKNLSSNNKGAQYMLDYELGDSMLNLLNYEKWDVFLPAEKTIDNKAIFLYKELSE